MKPVLFIIVCFVLVFSCRRSNLPGDLSGDGYIRGRLFLVDTLTQQAAGTPLGKKKVILSYAGSKDTLNYLLSTTTDDAGYFVFQNLRTDTTYRFFYEEKIGEVLYTAINQGTPSIDSLRLVALVNTTAQAGMHFIVRAGGGVVKDASICVFTNPTLYAAGTCDGNAFTLKTDEWGRASKFGLQKGSTYYLHASYNQNDTTRFVLRKTLQQPGGVLFDTLDLVRKPVNGFHILLRDTTGSVISGANVCLFTSRVLGAGNTCTGSTYSQPSDAKGISAKFDLPVDKYFILARIANESITLKAIDSIQILPDRIVYDTLVLRKE